MTMSGNGFVEALPRSAPRGWQWSTAVASCVTVVAAMAVAPAVHTAGTSMLHSSGKLERVIVRAVPGQVGQAEALVRNAGGSVGRELGIISGFAAQVPADAADALRATAVVTSVETDAVMHPLSDSTLTSTVTSAVASSASSVD